MFKLLSQREAGLYNPSEVRSLVETHKSQNVELSVLKDFVNPHGGSFNCLDLDPKEQRFLIASSGNGAIVIYDLLDGWESQRAKYEAVGTIGRSHPHAHKFSVETVQWYQDSGMFVTSGGDKTLVAWDPELLLPAETYRIESFVYSHHMSPMTEHSLVAVGCESPYVKLIDLRTGADGQILKGHTSSVISVQWSPKKPFELASGSKDNRVFMWDVRMARPNYLTFDQHNGAEKNVSKKTLHTAHSGYVVSVAFSSDGNHLLSYGTDSQLRLWDSDTGRNLRRNYGKWSNDLTRRALRLAVTPGTTETVAVYLPEGNNIQVLDVWSGAHVKSLCGHYGQVNCCFVHPGTREVFSASNDKQLLLWTPEGEAEKEYVEWEKEAGKKSVAASLGASLGASSQSSARPSQMQDSWSSDEGDA